MKMNKISFTLMIFGAFLTGIVTTYTVMNSTNYDNGLKTLEENKLYITQLLKLGNSAVSDDWCFGEKSEEPIDYSVGKFLSDYLEFFSNGGRKKFSSFTKCGIREKNMCGLSYGVKKVEGYSRTLWFKINPETNKIDPNSFVCMGLW